MGPPTLLPRRQWAWERREYKFEGDLWTRQPGETIRAWQAFQDYCRMGPRRSLGKLRESYLRIHLEDPIIRPPTMSAFTINLWSYQYGWVLRCRAWEIEQDRLYVETQHEVRKEMATRQVGEGRKFQEMAALLRDKAHQFALLLRPFTEETIDEDGAVVRVVRTALTPMEAAALLRTAAQVYKVGLDAERLALGEPTEITRQVLEEEAERIGVELGMPKEDVLTSFEEFKRRRGVG